MKTVAVIRDFSFRVSRNVIVQYRQGQIYRRVPEAQARAIVAAGAGEVVDGEAKSES